MTTVDRLAGAGRPASVGPSRPVQTATVGFALPQAAATAGGAEGIGEATPASLLGAMLAVQEAETNHVRDRAARRYGEAILTALRVLQADLLGGAARGAALGHLAGLAARLPEAADPGLAMLVRAVALRAKVELARGDGGEE